ncbi:MAG TPA: hypothetical protein VKQ30_17420 [Ktedonobacterales bacterium]|nr:hypothetical protein [Ktedonobacterales bacterium]
MDAIMLPGRISRESEFVRGLTGACGPNSAAMAERWSDQSRLETFEVYDRMRAVGRCDSNGSSTLEALADDARAQGYRVDVLPFSEPMPEHQWRAFFERHVGRQAIVMETSNGAALRDLLSGEGENANPRHPLQYHFIMVAGWNPGGYSDRARRHVPPGWWCADGDNFVAGDVLEYYPNDVLAASRPCAALAVYARHDFPAPHPAVPTPKTITAPAGWHDDGTTLTAPNGHPIVAAFRAHVLAHAWPPDNVPLEPQRQVAVASWQASPPGPGTRQVFLRTALRADPAGVVTELPLGAELLAVEARHTAPPSPAVPSTNPDPNIAQQVATMLGADYQPAPPAPPAPPTPPAH